MADREVPLTKIVGKVVSPPQASCLSYGYGVELIVEAALERYTVVVSGRQLSKRALSASIGDVICAVGFLQGATLQALGFENWHDAQTIDSPIPISEMLFALAIHDEVALDAMREVLLAWRARRHRTIPTNDTESPMPTDRGRILGPSEGSKAGGQEP